MKGGTAGFHSYLGLVRETQTGWSSWQRHDIDLMGVRILRLLNREPVEPFGDDG